MEQKLFERTLRDKIVSWLFKGKVIILYGPRQVGKTTLAKQILSDYPGSMYLNCERPQVWELIASSNPERIRSAIGDASLVVFDEAQKVPKIGSILKLLIDTYIFGAHTSKRRLIWLKIPEESCRPLNSNGG